MIRKPTKRALKTEIFDYASNFAIFERWFAEGECELSALSLVVRLVSAANNGDSGMTIATVNSCERCGLFDENVKDTREYGRLRSNRRSQSRMNENSVVLTCSTDELTCLDERKPWARPFSESDSVQGGFAGIFVFFGKKGPFWVRVGFLVKTGNFEVENCSFSFISVVFDNFRAFFTHFRNISRHNIFSGRSRKTTLFKQPHQRLLHIETRLCLRIRKLQNVLLFFKFKPRFDVLLCKNKARRGQHFEFTCFPRVFLEAYFNKAPEL